MGIDFDILEHCKKVRADHGPPYICPIKNCKRTYKSVCGLQYHLKSYDHDNPTPDATTSTTQASSTVTTTTTTTVATPKSHKKGGNHRNARSNSTTKTPSKSSVIQNVPEPLTYEEAQRLVQFEINGQAIRWNMNETLDVLSKDELVDDDLPIINENQEPPIQLPEANFKELDNYNICDAPPRPNAYIRFIEKSVEELDGEVEYDVDEEDTTWLAIMNERREASGLNPVSVDSLELLMDRLEKESYFQASVNGHNGAVVVDDDAVCCICMDGECQNTNVILFCDMCNLAVHQDCYGVPYIPEGQWLCRRCLQSPSRAVDCVLCPNQGGAFKQTDQSQWAHVVCALWIPEVRFANTVFLEPIDSIETIPAARWKLTCYICKQRNVGACIQCHKTNCYQAFHVTCAQQAGLYMKMDTVKDSGGDSQPVLVQKIAYCDVHAPPDSDSKKEDARIKMKNARKLLAKKRTTAPIILIPTIPPERIQEIGSLVTIGKKSQFIQRLIAYWTLKRQFRNGVPLLRRLQSSIPQTNNKLRDNINSLMNNTSIITNTKITTTTNSNNNNNDNRNNYNSTYDNIDTIELYNQLKYWQCLRQDLERARLLCELVRKREKIKLEQIKINEKCLNIQLKPLEASLKIVLDLIQAKDTNEIFTEPVDLEEVPDYTTVVSEPMDLSTMRKKLENGQYHDLKTMEKDFDLMIQNCLAYNNRDTVFYRAGIKMRDQCGVIFRQARKELEACGLLNESKNDIDNETKKNNDNNDNNNNNDGNGGNSGDNEKLLVSDIDKELAIINDKTGIEVIQKLEELLIKCQSLKASNGRTKRLKLIRNQLTKLKKILNTDSSQSDDNLSLNDLKNSQQQSLQIINNNSNNNSGNSGVNRRTAVLFTRKAQAALKDNKNNTNNNNNKDDNKEKEQSSSVSSTITTTITTTSSTKTIAATSAATTTTTTSKTSSNRRNKRSNKRNDLSSSTTTTTTQKKLETVPDSFKVYRSGDHITDDDRSDSDTSLSTCYSHDISEIDSDDDDDDDDNNDSSSNSGSSNSSSSSSSGDDDDDDQNKDDGKDKNKNKTKKKKKNKISDDDDDDGDVDGDGDKDKDKNLKKDDIVNDDKKIELKPLQLVWAKCRGYPWYPALIIDPKMPKGYVHKGVPIPSPPQEVLALSANYTEHVYLVLFFDAKRTWQWLPNEKLEIMGIDKERDEAKVSESRKPTDRKAVRKAYEHALQYISQINNNQDDNGDVVS